MSPTGSESFTIDELMLEEPWLRDLARRLARDDDEAEDVVQSTWLAALRRPPVRRDAGRPGLRAWLSRVARNEATARGVGVAEANVAFADTVVREDLLRSHAM